jgi:hypothetical protein
LENPTQWDCPYEAKDKHIGVLCLDNKITRAVINSSLQVVVDLCIVGDAKKQRWMEFVHHYKMAMTMMRKKDNFRDAEIEEVQKQCDLFFSKVGWNAPNRGCNQLHSLPRKRTYGRVYCTLA